MLLLLLLMSMASLLLQALKWPVRLMVSRGVIDKVHCSFISVLDALIMHQLEINILASNPLMISAYAHVHV